MLGLAVAAYKSPFLDHSRNIHLHCCFDAVDCGLPNRSCHFQVTCHELLHNGGFENGFDGWEPEGLGGCFVELNNGSLDPPGPGEPMTPIEGTFDALFAPSGPGNCTIKQSVPLPPNIYSATLSWKDRIRNFADFVDPDQEARTGITVDDGEFPVEVWSTNFCDEPEQLGPNARSFDVTPLLVGKSHAVVSLVEQVEIYYFNVNWDAVSLKVCVRH